MRIVGLELAAGIRGASLELAAGIRGATNQLWAVAVMMIILAGIMIGPIYGVSMDYPHSDGAGRPSIRILVATYLGSMVVGPVKNFLFCRCGQASRPTGAWYPADSFPLTGNVDAAAVLLPFHNPGPARLCPGRPGPAAAELFGERVLMRLVIIS
eukprot:g6519.t1